MTIIPFPLLSLTQPEVKARAKEHVARGAGAANLVYRDALTRGALAPEEVGLGSVAAEAWRRAFSVDLPEVKDIVREDGPLGETAKAVVALHDGLESEMVWIPMGRGRHTLCLSSQVGCKMGCTFCETGRMGLLRHLAVSEIVGQLLVARRVFGWSPDDPENPDGKRRHHNIVFMGMGEALDNADNVIQAIRVMNDPGGLGIAQERITVCTVGRVDGIARLKDAGFKRLNLSVSLNAATDAQRDAIMPVNRKTKLDALQAALVAYRPRRNFTLGVNYCLMPGLNDQREDATGIASFCEPLERVLVNVIPYNPGNAPLTRAPTDDEIDRFIGWLREEGLPVRKRITKGRSVMAACGQLGNVELRARAREDKRKRQLPTKS